MLDLLGYLSKKTPLLQNKGMKKSFSDCLAEIGCSQSQRSLVIGKVSAWSSAHGVSSWLLNLPKLPPVICVKNEALSHLISQPVGN